MLRFHVRQNLRSAFFLVVLAAVVAGPALLWHVNRNGLPDAWRALMERELADQGIHLRIGAIQYLPLRGIAARDVRVFADPNHEQELSSIGRILLDFDKTKLARGVLRLNKMQLSNADVLIPVEPMDPKSESLEISEVYGELLMPGGRVLEIRNARGKVGTLQVRMNARLLGYRSQGAGGLPEQDKSQHGKRREFIAVLSRELERWAHPEDQVPELELQIDGDLADMTTIRSTFDFHAPRISLNDHSVEGVRISGEMLGQLLLIDAFALSDARGQFAGSAEFHLKNRTGRFDVESTIDLVALARRWFGFNTPDALLVGGKQFIRSRGALDLSSEPLQPSVEATGELAFESVMLKGVVFDRISSAFSTRSGELFFRDLVLKRPDGMVSGKCLIQGPLVRLAIDSNLPIPLYKPFFEGQPLERILHSFDTDETSSARVVLEGGFDRTNRLSWAYQGHGVVERVAFNQVPVSSASARFSLSHHELDFHNGNVVLDTTDYRQRTAYNGPDRTAISVGGIRYLHQDRMIEVRDVIGEFWVPPVLSLFNKRLAENLESYQFHRPPALVSSGVIDLTPTGRTELDIRFATPSPAATKVLDESITFGRAKGLVSIRGSRIDVSQLELSAFGGEARASFRHADKRLSSEISWTGLDLPALAGAYGVTMQGGGTTTGRVEFSINSGKISTLTGKGNAGFENAHLFAVPMLGPLSPLIAGAVDDRRASYERAKDAFLTFEIRDGVVRSNDFRTNTTSLTFVGDGQVDLNEKTVDMTMRVNARGLLGIITLPLRPFSGLFQFRGTGPMREPNWENVMFTNPPPEQRQNLMNPPRAKIIGDP